jgi:hypothetical protein
MHCNRHVTWDPQRLSYMPIIISTLHMFKCIVYGMAAPYVLLFVRRPRWSSVDVYKQSMHLHVRTYVRTCLDKAVIYIWNYWRSILDSSMQLCTYSKPRVKYIFLCSSMHARTDSLHCIVWRAIWHSSMHVWSHMHGPAAHALRVHASIVENTHRPYTCSHPADRVYAVQFIIKLQRGTGRFAWS